MEGGVADEIMKIKWLGLVRVLGLALVLVYHFFKDLLPGGFFGVDLFFTLSGYLTTALFIEEFRKSGGFKWLDFCKRRFLRIFPPLLLSIIITLPFALLISPDFTGGIARQTAGALGFVTNYLEILGGGSYEAQLLPHLYIHTWSLALEMHFYLVWGLVCLGAVALLWLLVKNEKRRLPALKLALGIPAVICAVLCWWNMQRLFAANPGNPTAAYFDSLSHGLPFFIGAAAGALFGIKIKKSTAQRLNSPVCAGASIAALVLAAGGLVFMGLRFGFTEARTYKYGFLLASLLAAAIILASRALHEATPNLKRDPRAVSFIADTSYGVYLFHWPLYIVFGSIIAQNWLVSLVTFALSLGLAALSFYGAEPLLHKKTGLKEFLRDKPWLKITALATAILCVLGLAGSAAVLVRAPEINSLELPIMVGNVYQDAESAAELYNRAAAIQAEPIKDREKIVTWGDAVHNPSLADGEWIPAVHIESIPGGVSFLGDSVALGADRLLRDTIPNSYVNSEVSRSLIAGRQLLRDWQADGSLREYVVISLGSNGYGDWQAQIDGMLAELPAGCRVVFVTPFIGKPVKDIKDKEIAAYYRQLEQELPYVTVAEWAQAIAQHQDYLASDKIHLNGSKARQLFVDTVLQGIARAGEKPGKGG